MLITQLRKYWNILLINIIMFDSWYDIPVSFGGWAYCTKEAVTVYLKSGKVFHFDEKHIDLPSYKSIDVSVWQKDGKPHRLNGPAAIGFDKGFIIEDYWIEGIMYEDSKVYWSHPLVIEETIRRILESDL